MALEDHVTLGYTPVNYTAASDLIEDHIVGIDSALLAVSEASALGLAGRPGDSNTAVPSLAELTAAGIPAPIAYYTMNFTVENAVEPSDPDYFLVSGPDYIPFSIRNSKSSFANPIGAMSTNSHSEGSYVDGDHIEHRLISNMTFLCMLSVGKPIDVAQDYHIVEHSRSNTGSETGATDRLPYRLRLTAHDGDSASTVSARILEYSHYSGADAEIIATCELSGVGIGLPIGPEFGIGYTRAVGASTDVDFYVNGSHAGDQVTSLTNPGASGTDSTMSMHFGGKHNSSLNTIGSALRCCAIWDSVLTAAQIQAFYELCVGKT